MNYRVFGKTGFKASEVSLGTWQLGSKWGDPFDEQVAMNTLQAAYEQGVNLIDTADIYQDGMSEHTVGKFLKGKKDKVLIYISTLENHRKAGVGKSPNQSFLFI